jgi:hypothetical protein
MDGGKDRNSGGGRVWIATGHTDMRPGVNSLAFQRDPHAGDLSTCSAERGVGCSRFSVSSSISDHQLSAVSLRASRRIRFHDGAGKRDGRLRVLAVTNRLRSPRGATFTFTTS